MQNFALSSILCALTALAQAAAVAQDYQPVAIDFGVLRGSKFEDASHDKKPQLVKRDGSFPATLANEQTFYLANITLGTPGQNIGVLIDTGSSDLWVMNSDNPFCKGSSSSHSSYVETKLQELDHKAKPFKEKAQHVKEILGIHRKREEPVSSLTTASASTLITASPDDVTGSVDNKNIFSEIESAFGSFASEIGGGYSTYTIGGGASGYDYPSATEVSPSEATIDCNAYGTFDETSSDTFHSNDTDFLISYGDNSFASGTWAYDIFKLGNTSVENLSFALANETNSSTGVLGIGLAGLETTNVGSASTNSYTYENLPAKLVSQGIIPRNVYSLYLNDADASSGTILFGAVDHDKYTGPLTTVQVINTLSNRGYDSPVNLEVTVSNIAINSSESSVSSKSLSSTRYPALLDSGTTLTYMPATLIDTISKALGGTYSSSVGLYIVKCSQGRKDINITFSFTGASIQVPLDNFLVLVSSGSSLSSSDSGKSGSCAIAFMNSYDNRLILGDSFLRAAYAVYDLENMQISLAQANLNSKSENIEVVSSAVPSATTASDYSSTYSGGITQNTNIVGSGLSSSSGSSSDSDSGSSSGNTNSNSGASSITFSIGAIFIGVLSLSILV